MTNDTIDPMAEARLVRIMRYRDGRLPAGEADAVAAEIAGDPEAAEIAAAFADGDAAARAAWAELESGPVPLALARRVNEAARTRPRPRVMPMLIGWRAAAAVVVCLALGIAATVLLRGGSHDLHLAGAERSDPAWRPALVTALGQDPALAQVAFQDGKARLAITRWFDTAGAMHCAEYTITGEAAIRGGIACRRHDGGWDVIEQDQ